MGRNSSDTLVTLECYAGFAEMAHPRALTALQVWMIETGRTDSGLAAELADKLQNDPRYRTRKMKITDRSVGRWRKGLFAPRLPEHLAILSELSGGRVTAQSFAEARREHTGPNMTLAELERFDSKAAHVASRVLEQLRGVPGGVAVFALADAVASVLGTRPGASPEDMRLYFLRLLEDRMDRFE
jgi:hypothetical protein